MADKTVYGPDHIGIEAIPGVRLRAVCRGHTASITRLAWSKCGKFIASPSFDNSVGIWDGLNGSPLRRLIGHTRRVLCAEWSPDGSLIATGGDEERIRIWEVRTGK